ncbi:MAG: ABC transporter ATP-binding protein [Mycobacteriales bacterium]
MIGAPVIEFDRVTVTYDGAALPALVDATFSVGEGELCLVIGRTGAGKSTLLGAINGLVPYFTGGTLAGRVTVAGRDTATHPPKALADVVGVVGQDPIAGFVTDTVTDELAYGMEQLGLAPAVMRRRVEETIDLLGLADLRGRSLRTLSGGQQQRVAIGSVLTVHPAVLVLDEPTSALDPGAAEDVLAAITRIVHDLGVTVVAAEHRLERVVQYADHVITVDAGGRVSDGEPATALATAPVVPPVVQLGRSAGWTPLALSVRDARRMAGPLRARLASIEPPRTPIADRGPAKPALLAEGSVVRQGALVAVRGVDLALAAGQTVALMGRNGAGKSSLLWALAGAGRRAAGRVALADGRDPAELSAVAARREVALVPQTPADLLYRETVAAECAQGDRDAGAAAGTTSALLVGIAPDIESAKHPRDLSEGQRLALVLAIQLAGRPAVLLLDEPTRGLDYPGKHVLAGVLHGLAAGGSAVLVATHDVEFVARCAQRVVLLSDGDVVADGPTDEVVHGSPMFAPQVSKILGAPWLTVEQIDAALAGVS